MSSGQSQELAGIPSDNGSPPEGSGESYRLELTETLDGISDAFVAFDRDWRFTYVNRRAEELAGMPKEAMLGRVVWDAYPAILGTELECQYRRVMAERAPAQFEMPGLNGGRWYGISIYPSAEGISVYSRDITAQKEVERALQVSETRFRMLFDQSPFSMQVMAPDGSFVQANRAWEQLWGATLDMVRDYNMLHDEQLVDRGIMPYIRRAFEGETVVVPPTPYAPELGRYKGRELWTSAVVYPVKNDDGSLREVVLIHEDITERKLAEDALRESEERFRFLVETTSDAVWRFDLTEPMPVTLSEEEQIAWGYRTVVLGECNAGMARLYGYQSADEMIGLPLREILPRSDFINVEFLRRFIRSGYRLIEDEAHTRAQDGSERVVLNNLVGAIREGKLRAAFGTSRDITLRRQAEAALREQHARAELERGRLQAVLDALPVGVFISDPGGALLEANAAARDIWGGETPLPRDVREYGAYAAWWPGSGRRVEPHEWGLAQALATGQPCLGQELEIEGADGQHKFILNSALPIRDSSGAVVGGVAVNVDITERRLTEQILFEANRRLRFLSTAAGELLRNRSPGEFMNTLFGELAEILDLNVYLHFKLDRDEEMLRLAASGGLAEQDVKDLDRLAIGQAVCGTVAALGTPLIVEDVQNSTDPRTAHIRGLGMTAYACYPLRVGNKTFGTLSFGTRRRHHFDEASLGLIQAVGDVLSTAIERQQAEDAVRESEARFRTIFDQAAVGISERKLDGTIVRVNERLCEMLGFTREEMIGRHWSEFTHPEDVGITSRHIQSLLAAEIGSIRLESRFRRQGGGVLWGLVTASLLRDPVGNTERFVAVIQDISDRKQAEEQLRELNLTLEVRVAKRTAQLRRLATELSSAEQRERRRIATTLHDHLQQILVAAKLGVDRLMSHAEDAELHATLGGVYEMLGEAIDASRTLAVELSPPVLYDRGLGAAFEWLERHFRERHGLDVTVQIAPGAEPAEEEIQAFLFQSVRELLFNVIKHSRAVRARVAMAPFGRDQVLITVEDDGVGSDPERLASVEETTAGFGLFNIQQRLELLGGRFQIETSPGSGCRVTLLAPRERLRSELDSERSFRTDEQEATDPEPLMTGENFLRPVRVVLADDHKILREGLAHMLRDLPDIEIVGQAENGQVAVDLARDLRPDVVVMDVTMPRMDGIQATRAIKQELPEIRIVGLSMHEQGDMAKTMIEAGAETYLTKGGPAGDLIKAIRG